MRKLNRKNRWRVSITNTLIFAILLRRILTAFTHKLALRARTMLQSCRYARKIAKICLLFVYRDPPSVFTVSEFIGIFRYCKTLFTSVSALHSCFHNFLQRLHRQPFKNDIRSIESLCLLFDYFNKCLKWNVSQHFFL